MSYGREALTPTATSPRSSFAALRQFVQPQPRRLPAVERCELCRARIPSAHRHLLEVAARRVVCACDACALRFHDVVEGRFKLIPRDVRALSGFVMNDAAWAALALPINLAFFFHSSSAEKVVAFYPSPAGATESLLPLPAWKTLATDNPILATMDADVEALLVNRVSGAREYFLTPIDTCFELVGLIRLHWRGLSGGEEAWQEIRAFFQRLNESGATSAAGRVETSHA